MLFHLELFSIESLKTMYPLAAIWLSAPIVVGDGTKTRRLCEGMTVTVIDGKIVDCNGLPTHRITGCNGRLDNTYLELTTVNISTNQAEFIKL